MNIEEKTFIMKSGISILSFVSAIVIGFIALFIPPEGIIDSSVLWFVAQMLVMTASLLGIDLKVDNLRHKISVDGNKESKYKVQEQTNNNQED